MGNPFKIPSQIKGASYKLPGDFERSFHLNKPYVYLDGKRSLYTRATTYIDCLSDRTMLEKWKQRLILTGLVTEVEMYAPAEWDITWQRLLHTDLDDRKEMNARAEEAFKAGDGYLKAQQGTDMHTITNAWDMMEPLPQHGHREAQDFAAWLTLVNDHDLIAVDIERKCVVDELKTAGTPDRTYWYDGELVIGDLKTGRIDFDPGKMAMQLAMYSRGQWYDPDTYERTPMGVSQEVGLILHVPNGEASATLYRADLQQGWAGVQMASLVRGWRNTSKKLLSEVSLPLEVVLRS